jgi:hypothetical protein
MITPREYAALQSSTMRAAHTLVAWTLTDVVGSEKRGQVRVSQWRPRTAPQQALPYANFAGATIGARRSLSEADAMKALGRAYAELRTDDIPADLINEVLAATDAWIPR